MRESMHTRKKKSLSCYGKALFSYGLIAALLFLPQAAWAEIPEGKVSGENAIAIGEDSKAYGENSIAIGAGAYVDSKDGGGVAIGAGAEVTEGDSVAIGSGSIASEADIVSVGDSASNLYRKITNVAQGDISEKSTEAVTGGQLFVTNNRVTAVETNVTNIQSDVASVSDRVTVTENQISSINQSVIDIANDYNTINDSAVKYDDSSKTHITLNEGGEATQLTNVADGRIAAGSRDAATGNQLYQAYQRMNDLDRSIDVVGAHAAAMSALHPVPYNKYEPTTFSAGVGTYHDECAMAIGAFHYIRPNLMVNVGASVCSDGDVMGRIGLSVAIGKSTRKQPELAHDVAGMQEQMSVMQAKLTELEEQNRRDKEIIQKNAELIRELMQKYEAK